MAGERPRSRQKIRRGDAPPLLAQAGPLLRERRRELGLSQEEVGEKSGLSQPGVSYIERGLVLPRLETLERLALALQWTLEDYLAAMGRRARGGEKYKRIDGRGGGSGVLSSRPYASAPAPRCARRRE
jgi:DNA-binding XRE family transcriptional regulator